MHRDPRRRGSSPTYLTGGMDLTPLLLIATVPRVFLFVRGSHASSDRHTLAGRMDHSDHVNLLRGGVGATGGVWADFGAGAGAFTLALADLLGPAAEIIAIDRDAGRLRANERAMRERFPHTNARYVVADFSEPLELPVLDGIVMANALHFSTDQSHIMRLLRSCLAPDAPLLVVEYNVEHGNSAVPYPVPFSRWETLAREAGFRQTKLLSTRPSRFLREIYSAMSW